MGSALPKIGVPSGAESYDAALEGLVRLDEVQLKDRKNRLPPLYQSGVTYDNTPFPVWKTAVDVNREKKADCEGLSGWRTAELRVTGEDPLATLRTYRTGPNKFHAVVRRGDGVIEDPSRLLGMPIADMAAYQEKQAMAFGRQNVAGWDGKRVQGPLVVIGEDTSGTRSLSFDIYRIPNQGWAGVIRLPIDIAPGLPSGKAITLQTSPSATPAAAAVKTGNIANLVDALPDSLKSKIPPEAMAAIAVLSNPAVMNTVKDVGKKAEQVASGAVKEVGKALGKLKFW